MDTANNSVRKENATNTKDISLCSSSFWSDLRV